MYYVYFHKSLNNVIVYVGKGTGKRAWSVKNRSKRWNNFVSSNKYTVEIFKDQLTDIESKELETKLIAEYSPMLNSISSSVVKSMSTDFHDLFYYDETSPSGLRWKIDSNCRNPKYKRFKDDVVGSIMKIRNDHSVWITKIKGKSFYLHRIVYFLKHGSLSEDVVINHIDCNPLNNKISNLETCTVLQNNCRSKILTQDILSKSNTSSHTNIAEFKDTKKNGNIVHRVKVTISINSKTVTKSFSYNKYGKELAWKLALDFKNKIITERTNL